MWPRLGFIDILHLRFSFAIENKTGKYRASLNPDQKTTAVMGCHV